MGADLGASRSLPLSSSCMPLGASAVDVSSCMPLGASADEVSLGESASAGENASELRSGVDMYIWVGCQRPFPKASSCSSSASTLARSPVASRACCAAERSAFASSRCMRLLVAGEPRGPWRIMWRQLLLLLTWSTVGERIM